jgi:hypothetical protein
MPRGRRGRGLQHPGEDNPGLGDLQQATVMSVESLDLPGTLQLSNGASIEILILLMELAQTRSAEYYPRTVRHTTSGRAINVPSEL